MRKLFAYLMTLIGIIYILPLLGVSVGMAGSWIVALAFLVIGIMGITEK